MVFSKMAFRGAVVLGVFSLVASLSSPAFAHGVDSRGWGEAASVGSTTLGAGIAATFVPGMGTSAGVAILGGGLVVGGVLGYLMVKSHLDIFGEKAGALVFLTSLPGAALTLPVATVLMKLDQNKQWVAYINQIEGDLDLAFANNESDGKGLELSPSVHEAVNLIRKSAPQESPIQKWSDADLATQLYSDIADLKAKFAAAAAKPAQS